MSYHFFLQNTIMWTFVLIFATLVSVAFPQSISPRLYDMGNPVLSDIWVDRQNGDDSRSGSSRDQALATITEAWNRIPQDPSTGYRIQIVSGTYSESQVPVYWEAQHGDFEFPIILNAVDGAGTVILPSMNIYNCRYLYLQNLTIEASGGDALHFEQCAHVLVRDTVVRGIGDIDNFEGPQEALKANQCQYMYIENSDISGGWDNAIDFVNVQYGHIVANKIHRAHEWCCYLKGGSAYFRVEGNELYDGGTGGFSAGQGTGFEFMVSPWLHYEAYDIKFFNNIIHDTDGAGMGVDGGYNILLAYNTLYRVGQNGHAIEVIFGLRACDGDVDQCKKNLLVGGWGTITPGVEEPIPDRNVFIYNNIVLNPPGYASAWSHFAIYGPQTPSANSNIPSPAETDVNLDIRGNLIWNGPADLPLGVEESDQGCQPGNPTCYAAQLVNNNTINTQQPVLVNPDHGDFHPKIHSTIFTTVTYSIPDFPGHDLPLHPAVPAGNLVNQIDRDYAGNTRSSSSPPGAFVSSTSTAVDADLLSSLSMQFTVLQNYPNPFNPSTTISYILSQQADVHIQIYNTLGQRIRTLEQGRQSPGAYQVIWNGGDDSGKLMPSSIYYYQVIAGNDKETHIMSLVK
jgi:hypothetical protein